MAPLLDEDDDAVRYNEEFDMGIKDAGGEEEERPSPGEPNLFPDSPEDEPEEADED